MGDAHRNRMPPFQGWTMGDISVRKMLNFGSPERARYVSTGGAPRATIDAINATVLKGPIYYALLIVRRCPSQWYAALSGLDYGRRFCA